PLPGSSPPRCCAVADRVTRSPGAGTGTSEKMRLAREGPPVLDARFESRVPLEFATENRPSEQPERNAEALNSTVSRGAGRGGTWKHADERALRQRRLTGAGYRRGSDVRAGQTTKLIAPERGERLDDRRVRSLVRLARTRIQAALDGPLDRGTVVR